MVRGLEYYSHFAKRLRDLKQNGTQKKTPFSGTVFNTLSHGVVALLRVVAQKTTLSFFDSQSDAFIQWFVKLPLATK